LALAHLWRGRSLSHHREAGKSLCASGSQNLETRISDRPRTYHFEKSQIEDVAWALLGLHLTENESPPRKVTEATFSICLSLESGRVTFGKVTRPLSRERILPKTRKEKRAADPQHFMPSR
jgi:hypothetical protein